MLKESHIYKILEERSAPEQPLKERRNISVKEKGRRYLADIKPPRNTVVFQIDGNIIKEGRKCDKLILSDDDVQDNCCFVHFIELKGKDIEHAITQLQTTLDNPLFKDSSISKKFARIVGASFPSSSGNPIVEKYRNIFKTQYKCDLRTLKSNQPDVI